MPIAKKDLPLEMEDHVILDEGVVHSYDYASPVALMVLKGTHGVVKAVFLDGAQVAVEFGGQLYAFTKPADYLTLYRRSQHSKRRT